MRSYWTINILMSYWPKHIDNKSLCFIHIPKTAGTSVQRWMKKTYKLLQKRTHAPVNDPVIRELDIPKFTIVRNPYDRAVSFYTYREFDLKKKLLHNPKSTTLEIELMFHKKGFNRWAERYFHKPWEESKRVDLYNPTEVMGLVPKYTQSTWVVHKNVLSVDIVLKMENLNEDFQKIQDIAGVSYGLGHRRASRHSKKGYQAYYDAPTKKLIEKYYGEDLDRFEYTY